MQFRIDVYHHFSGDSEARVLAALSNLTGKVSTMALDLTAVLAATNRVEALCTSVGVELGELKQAVDNAVTAQDLAALQEVSRRLGAASDALAAAATAADITPETPVEQVVTTTPPDPVTP